jgi:probable phosphoglycerate mutase
MQILFARHGNTFAPGDRVVWVGRETDLPLVEKGLAQAVAVAEALGRAGLVPDAIFAASLARTRRSAEIVAETLGVAPPFVDDRLDELDYGRWAGRTSAEIEAEGPGMAEMAAAWNQADCWPEQAGWGSRKDEVMAALQAFVQDRLTGGGPCRPLVVSSNGILRFLPRLLLSRVDERPSFKMRTGHLGVVEDGAVRCWDTAPANFVL